MQQVEKVVTMSRQLNIPLAWLTADALEDSAGMLSRS